MMVESVDSVAADPGVGALFAEKNSKEVVDAEGTGKIVNAGILNGERIDVRCVDARLADRVGPGAADIAVCHLDLERLCRWSTQKQTVNPPVDLHIIEDEVRVPAVRQSGVESDGVVRGTV